MQPALATSSASDAMSILDTITSLNQEASVRATSGTDRVRKGQTGEESLQLLSEDSQQDMTLVEEAEGQHDAKMEVDEPASEAPSFEVKLEDAGEQMDLSRDGVMEEVKMEEGELGPEELMEEDKDKVAGKLAGKTAEEKQDDDQQRSASQAKQKARERIKEGESFVTQPITCQLTEAEPKSSYHLVASSCRVLPGGLGPGRPERHHCELRPHQ